MLEELIPHFKNRMLLETDFERLQETDHSEIRTLIGKTIERFIQEEKVILSKADQERLIQQILDDSVGFGPLEQYLQDDAVTEIMVNGPNEIFIEKAGVLTRTDTTFRDDSHVRHIIDRIVAPVGRRIDESTPMADARLKDGSRVHAIIPPVSLTGPVLTIRKFRCRPYSMQDLLEKQSLHPDMARFLESAVKSKLNILISGGTGSGKTTVLNVLSSFISEGERIITIEDSAELQLQKQHVVSLETRSVNVEGRGEISIRELLRNSLRMRPDRIVVGEVRGAEAFDMLQAMNTGHKGSLTTIHANSPADALTRLESMVLISGMSLPIEVIRKYIFGSIDLIVQTERSIDGKRRIVAIAEAADSDKTIFIHPIFEWKQTGIQANGEVVGYYEKTQTLPASFEQMKQFGVLPVTVWEDFVW